MTRALDLSDVLKARAAIRGIAARTPMVPSLWMEERLGRPVHLKLETTQPIGAFKLRGAAYAISRLSAEQRERGVVCSSTGNHGRAVAYAAKAMGGKATVCLSNLVPEVKVKAIEALGAEVRRVGQSQDDAQVEAERLVAEEDMAEIPPFDHADVVAGQGTIGLEILEDLPEAGTVVVPLSGGGLIGGIALAVKTLKPAIKVIGLTMDRGAAMHDSLAAGKPVDVSEVPSLADSLGGGIGLDNRYTFDLCRRYLDETLLLSEAEIYRGMAQLYREDRLVTEGGGAVGAAAILAGRLEPAEGPVVVVISGQNVDMDVFTRIVTGQTVTLGDLQVAG